MSNALPPGMVVPNPGPAKTIGLLNIIFGILLGLQGLVGIASTAMMPYMTKMMTANQKQLEAQVERDQQARIKGQIDELAKQEEKAESDEEKARIRADIEAVRSQPKPFVPNTTMGLEMATDPVANRFNLADAVTGLVLNVAMVIAGFGLMRLASWGRTMSLWVAGLKIVRALTLAVVVTIVVVPVMAKRMDEEMGKMGQQMAASRPGNPNQGARVQQTLKQTSGIMGAFLGVFYAGMYGVLYPIYPVVSLIVLTRPRVRAAFIAGTTTKPESDPLT